MTGKTEVNESPIKYKRVKQTAEQKRDKVNAQKKIYYQNNKDAINAKSKVKYDQVKHIRKAFCPELDIIIYEE